MLTLPTEKIAVVVIVLIASLASPLAISCCFYIALLCKNNKPFQGKVSPEVDKTHVDTFQMQALNQAQSQAAQAQVQSLERGDSYNEIMLKQRKQKIREQIVSAKRSLSTNLCVALVMSMTLVVTAALPKPANFYWIVMATVVEKTALPIVTSVANFGNVKFAFSNAGMF